MRQNSLFLRQAGQDVDCRWCFAFARKVKTDVLFVYGHCTVAAGQRKPSAVESWPLGALLSVCTGEAGQMAFRPSCPESSPTSVLQCKPTRSREVSACSILAKRREQWGVTAGEWNTADSKESSQPRERQATRAGHHHAKLGILLLLLLPEVPQAESFGD